MSRMVFDKICFEAQELNGENNHKLHVTQHDSDLMWGKVHDSMVLTVWLKDGSFQIHIHIFWAQFFFSPCLLSNFFVVIWTCIFCISYFLLVQIYFMDTQIWYTIWSALVGALVGLMDHLGEVFFFVYLISNEWTCIVFIFLPTSLCLLVFLCVAKHGALLCLWNVRFGNRFAGAVVSIYRINL